MERETKKMIEKRICLEGEMDSIISRLTLPDSGPGLSGPLTDPHGFPRSDIDIPTVRADRNRLSVLRNDYKDITDKINQNIQLLHSARLPLKSSPHIAPVEGSKSEDLSSSSRNVSAMDVDLTVNIPFALVDEISVSSPAAEDGIQLGDQIVKFGNVEAGENLLPKLASEAQSNQGREVSVVVLRQGACEQLKVTPRTWHGRGLLGCHFQIL